MKTIITLEIDCPEDIFKMIADFSERVKQSGGEVSAFTINSVNTYTNQPTEVPPPPSNSAHIHDVKILASRQTEMSGACDVKCASQTSSYSEPYNANITLHTTNSEEFEDVSVYPHDGTNNILVFSSNYTSELYGEVNRLVFDFIFQTIELPCVFVPPVSIDHLCLPNATQYGESLIDISTNSKSAFARVRVVFASIPERARLYLTTNGVPNE